MFVVELRGLIVRIDVQNIAMAWVGLVLVYEAVCREKGLQLRLSKDSETNVSLSLSGTLREKHDRADKMTQARARVCVLVFVFVRVCSSARVEPMIPEVFVPRSIRC